MADTTPDEVTLAVVAARLEDVREDIRGMRSDLATHRAELVPRGEWEQRNHHVDGRFQEQGREIGQIRTALETEIRSRRLPWPSVVSALVAVAALAVALVPVLANR